MSAGHKKDRVLPFVMLFIISMGVLIGYFADRAFRVTSPDPGVAVDSCMQCHAGMSGFSPAHLPENIGCAACHLGDPGRNEKKAAHQGLLRVPGNSSAARQSCGAPQCHPVLVENHLTSLMTTGRGLVGVNRYVFGESDTPDSHTPLSEIGDSEADEHLRQLCASCHLAREKTTSRAIDELSRGGGCTACHLSYSDTAKEHMDRWQQKKELPEVHPALTIAVGDEHCFGCHSRSGRISTSYEGWHETLLEPADIDPADPGYRVLQDGRVFTRQPADVHFSAGLACIDCHTWRETMGDGQVRLHQEEQIEIACEDCHFSGRPRTVPADSLGRIDRKIVQVRGWSLPGVNFLRMGSSGKALINTRLGSQGETVLIGKNSAQSYTLKPPAAVCRGQISGHERLTCSSCHAAWAPVCASCHTEFDPDAEAKDHLTGEYQQGGWVEYSDEFAALPPALGIHKNQAGEERIVPFIPGMILTIKSARRDTTLFRRLYAPSSPHTTARKGRSCRSCHAEPFALGFGTGRLRFDPDRGEQGAWSFEPDYVAHPHDGLPHDAWTGFLQTRTGMVSTRTGSRPFSRAEQKRILRVGACLTCHAWPDKIYLRFQHSLRTKKEACRGDIPDDF